MLRHQLRVRRARAPLQRDRRYPLDAETPVPAARRTLCAHLRLLSCASQRDHGRGCDAWCNSYSFLKCRVFCPEKLFKHDSLLHDSKDSLLDDRDL